MKSNPYSGWPLFSIRPYMCTPHSLQACRWMVALGSTTDSLLPFALTLRLSRPTTATCENSAPFGFQHLVQPHTWLCAGCRLFATSTLFCEQFHASVPPAKLFAAGFIPPSTDGCILRLLMAIPPLDAAFNASDGCVPGCCRPGGARRAARSRRCCRGYRHTWH